MVTTEQKTILSVKDLQIYFNTDEGTVRAVDGVNFEIAQGKTLGVVGAQMVWWKLSNVRHVGLS